MAIFPDAKKVHEDIPDRARIYLKQALESPPDGAAMLANSAVDAMLKERGYKKGSIRDRIDKAVADHVLTGDMGAWAHDVRSISNDPRHADEDQPHISQEEADQAINFAETLANLLFVLPKRIQRGKQATTEAADKAAISVAADVTSG